MVLVIENIFRWPWRLRKFERAICGRLFLPKASSAKTTQTQTPQTRPPRVSHRCHWWLRSKCNLVYRSQHTKTSRFCFIACSFGIFWVSFNFGFWRISPIFGRRCGARCQVSATAFVRGIVVSFSGGGGPWLATRSIWLDADSLQHDHRSPCAAGTCFYLLCSLFVLFSSLCDKFVFLHALLR